MTNQLFGVLTRFQIEEVIVIGDIKPMFYKVGISEEDISLLRFL